VNISKTLNTPSSMKKKLRLANRKLARAKRGSSQRKKTKKHLQRIHLKVQRSRNDFLQKESSKMVNENQVIIFEDLNVKGMARNHFAKHILDCGWGKFVSISEYKAVRNDKKVKKVLAAYTSQTCSQCGYTDKQNRKTQAKFKCQLCGHKENADKNASKNILGRGTANKTERKAAA